jgi:hypothetical protein
MCVETVETVLWGRQRPETTLTRPAGWPGAREGCHASRRIVAGRPRRVDPARVKSIIADLPNSPADGGSVVLSRRSEVTSHM